MSWIKNIFLFLFFLLIALKGSDIVLGLAFPEQAFGIKSRGTDRSIILKEINPFFSANLVPSDDYIKKRDSLEKQSYRVESDQNGFLITGNNYNRDGFGQHSIVFLGGSTTEQLYVSENQRWQSILERNLNGSVKIYNGGVSGNNIIHSTLNLVAKVLPLQPEYVVLMHNINDLGLLRQTGSYWKAPGDRSIIQTEENRTVFLIARQFKDTFIPNIYKFVESLKFKGDDFSATRLKENYPIEIIENEFRNALVMFIHICRSWNIEPILMTQFNRINLNDSRFVKSYSDISDNIEVYVQKYERLNEIIRVTGLELNVDVIDLANLVPSSSEYIYDSIHLNNSGSQYVAEILTDFFQSKLSL